MARRDSFRRRLTGWLANLRRRFFGWITVPRAVALLLGLLGVLIGVGGYLYRYCACQDWPNIVAGWEQLFLDFYANVATTLVGITVVVLTIDLLNERRAEQQLKEQLIREMGSRDNGISLRAVEEIRAHGWVEDGSLKGVHLGSADLRGVSLREADLQNAVLSMANLEDAILLDVNLRGANMFRTRLVRTVFAGADLRDVRNLTDQQLVTARALIAARMRKGNTYDGRFNLFGDKEMLTAFAEADGKTSLTDDDWAEFYGVSIEEYQYGQKWARENLPRLRREAGLEQEEAVETGDGPQPEEQQSAAPSSSAPPSPVVPTQSLLSFTVRRLIGLFWPFGR